MSARGPGAVGDGTLDIVGKAAGAAKVAVYLLTDRVSMARTSAAALQRALAQGRRAGTRFEVRLNLWYAAMRRGDAPTTGAGESVNISRSGLLFRATGKLTVDDSLVVVLDWPFRTPDGEPLKLLLTGQVVRTKRPQVGMAIHSHRLLREQDVAKRLGGFWGPVESGRELRTPDARALVLVDEDDETAALLVAEIAGSYNVRIERVDAAGAAAALAEPASPPISVLVTRTVDLLRAAGETPVILTVAEGVQLPEEIGDRPGTFVLYKPIQAPELRNAIEQTRGMARAEGASQAFGRIQ